MYTLLLYWLYFHEETSVCGIIGIWMNHNNVCWIIRRNFDCVNVGVTGSVISLYVIFMRTKGLFILLMIANAAIRKIDPIYYNDFICIYGYCSLQNRWFIFHFYLKYQIVLNHIKPNFFIYGYQCDASNSFHARYRFWLVKNVNGNHDAHMLTKIAKFMGSTWGPPGLCCPPDGPHVGPMNLAIWEAM